MPVNPYFNMTTFVPEQTLVDNLIIESIQIYGHNAYYLRRDAVDLDTLFGEDPLAHYPQAYAVEVYLKSSESFQGQSEFISKFGLQIEDQATFLVSTTRFAQVVAGALSRPRENDILYIEMTPTNRYLFEIRFVEDKEQLFQLGKLYTYEIRCELMNYSHERIDTLIPDIDDAADRATYTLNLQLSSGTGTFQADEFVYQGESYITSIASGQVTKWDAPTNVLSIHNIVGEFANTLTVIGQTSNAHWTMATTPSTSPAVNDPIADNDVLTTESSTVVLTSNNPLLEN
jgi:hypothetical protein